MRQEQLKSIKQDLQWPMARKKSAHQKNNIPDKRLWRKELLSVVFYIPGDQARCTSNSLLFVLPYVRLRKTTAGPYQVQCTTLPVLLYGYLKYPGIRDKTAHAPWQAAMRHRLRH